MDPIISTHDLSFIYQRQTKPSLNNIDFQLCKGKSAGIVGHTGAGKTTFLHCLSGIIPQFYKGRRTGEITLFNEKVTNQKVRYWTDRLGFLFQDFETQLFSSTVALEVAFPLENRAIHPQTMRTIVQDTLKTVGLEHMKDFPPYELSGGQKQRLAIASIIAMQPQLLFLDEPTTDLDPLGKQQIFRLCQRLQEQDNTTLIIEHETEQMLTLDRIYLFVQGQKVAEGPPISIFSQHSLLQEAGVKPPEMLELLSRLNIEPILLTANDVAKELAKRHYDLSPMKVNELNSQEKPQKNPVIELDEVSFNYRENNQTLEKISLSVFQGEFIAILGANGSGKTTMAKQMNKLLEPSKGCVRFHSREIKDSPLSELGKKIGFIFQNPDHMIFSPTVFEEVAFGPKNYGFDRKSIRHRVEEALDLVQMSGMESADPFNLTKGERQKLAVASVLACEPEVIILDEPTTGLDYGEQCKMMELLRHLNNMGHTIIIITHSLWVVCKYCSRVVIMDHGSIIADGPVRKVLLDFQLLERAALSPTPSLQLSKILGHPLLTVDEIYDCLCPLEANQGYNEC